MFAEDKLDIKDSCTIQLEQTGYCFEYLSIFIHVQYYASDFR